MDMTLLAVNKIYEKRNQKASRGIDQYLCHGGSSLCEHKYYDSDGNAFKGDSRTLSKNSVDKKGKLYTRVIMGADRSNFTHGWLPLTGMLARPAKTPTSTVSRRHISTSSTSSTDGLLGSGGFTVNPLAATRV
jgi:hypothetical protein